MMRGYNGQMTWNLKRYAIEVQVYVQGKVF